MSEQHFSCLTCRPAMLLTLTFKRLTIVSNLEACYLGINSAQSGP